MFDTRHTPGSFRRGSRRVWPAAFTMLILAFAVVPGRAADPPRVPRDAVDDFRAAFQTNAGRISGTTFELAGLRQRLVELGNDPATPAGDIADNKAKIARAESEQAAAVKARNAVLEPLLKDRFGSGEPGEQIALINVVGDEAQRYRYPGKDNAGLLAQLHPEVPYLIALAKPDARNTIEVRRAAVLALGKTNGDPDVIVPILAQTLRDQHNPVSLRLAAVKALGRPIHSLLRPPGTPTRNIGRPITENEKRDRDLRLASVDGGPLTWPALLDGLSDPSPAVRLACAAAAQELTAALPDTTQVEMTWQLLPTFDNLFKAFRDNMPKLLVAMDDPEPAVRRIALAVLQDLTSTRRRVTNTVLFAPATAPGGQAAPGATESQYLSEALKRAVPAALDALRDPDATIRLGAAYVLEDVGDESTTVVAAEIAALKDSDPFVRWTILRTLARLDQKQAATVVPAVIPTLADLDIDLRLASITTLAHYGKAAGVPAVNAIARFLPNDDSAVQVAAFTALRTIGVTDAPTLRLVAEQLHNPDPAMRASAAEVLGRGGKNATEFRAALREALNDEHDQVRVAAADALLRIGK